jgi:hypothetical protein
MRNKNKIRKTGDGIEAHTHLPVRSRLRLEDERRVVHKRNSDMGWSLAPKVYGTPALVDCD